MIERQSGLKRACAKDPDDFVMRTADESRSTNWAYGGPIIDRADISTMKVGIANWKATLNYGGGGGGFDQYGPTPLVAAMRCYVASRLGDEVEVPEELT